MSDLISRQPMIDKFESWLKAVEGYSEGELNMLKAVLYELKVAPSAQSESQEGHWIPYEMPFGGGQYECSRCGVLWEFNDGTPEDNEAYFCPKCGADMRGKKDEHID